MVIRLRQAFRMSGFREAELFPAGPSGTLAARAVMPEVKRGR